MNASSRSQITILPSAGLAVFKYRARCHSTSVPGDAARRPVPRRWFLRSFASTLISRFAASGLAGRPRHVQVVSPTSHKGHMSTSGGENSEALHNLALQEQKWTVPADWPHATAAGPAFEGSAGGAAMSRSAAGADVHNKVDYETEIRTFYKQHNPVKLAEVPALLKKYAGKHRKLLASLRKKYLASKSGDGPANKPAAPVPTKRRAPEPARPGEVPVDYGDEDDNEQADDNGAGAASGTAAPNAKKGKAAGDEPGAGSAASAAAAAATAAAGASATGNTAAKQRSKATVFCCAKCGHDCLELNEPTRIGSLRRRTSDGSAVIPEATLLKSLRAVPGKVNEFRRVSSNPSKPGRGGLERQFTFLCAHCSAALGYRHKPLTAEAELCYILRGSIVSSASETLAGAGADGSGNSKLLAKAEECTNLVCHVTPGTQKACITFIDDNEEVWVSVKENSHRGRAQAAFLALISVTLGVRIGKLRIQEGRNDSVKHLRIDGVSQKWAMTRLRRSLKRPEWSVMEGS